MSVTTVDATVIRPANENDGTADRPKKSFWRRRGKVTLTPQQRRLKWQCRCYFAGVLALGGLSLWAVETFPDNADSIATMVAILLLPALYLGAEWFCALYLLNDVKKPKGKQARMTREQAQMLGCLLRKRAGFLTIVYFLALMVFFLGAFMGLSENIVVGAMFSVFASLFLSTGWLAIQTRRKGLAEFVDYSGRPGGSDDGPHSGDSSCSIYSDSTYRNVPGNIYHVY